MSFSFTIDKNAGFTGPAKQISGAAVNPGIGAMAYNPANNVIGHMPGVNLGPGAQLSKTLPDIPVQQGTGLADQLRDIYNKNPVLWGGLLLAVVLSLGLKVKY
jgi:hypothetical protein